MMLPDIFMNILWQQKYKILLEKLLGWEMTTFVEFYFLPFFHNIVLTVLFSIKTFLKALPTLFVACFPTHKTLTICE